MAEILTYQIIVDPKTGKLTVVEQDLKKVEKQTQKIGDAAKQTSNKFGGMGSLIKGLGLAAVIATFTRQAFKGSDALQQAGSEMLSMVSTITKELEPAFVVIARAVKGLSEVLTGLVKIIVNQVKGSFAILSALLRGDFSEAVKTAGDTLKKTFEISADAATKAIAGFGGRSQIIMKQTVDNMLSELLRDLKNTELTGEEKLKIIDENEKKLLGLLRQTGDFRQADDDTRKQLEEKLLKKLAAEREAAELEQMTQTLANFQAIRDLRAVEAEQVLADEESTTQEKLDALAVAFEAENEVIAQDAANKKSSDEAVKAATLKAQLKFQADLAAVNKKAFADEKKLAEQKAIENTKEFKNVQRLAQATISGAANAAAAEFAISQNAGLAARAAAADAIRTAANEAAKIVAIKGAEATAKAFARGGGFPTGIPFAVATAAAYTALAATISIAGGVAAAAVSPPSGGGATAAPLAPEGDFGGPAPVTIQSDALGGIEAEQETVNAPPGGVSTAAGNTIIVNITGAELLDDDEVVRGVRDALLRDGAR